MSVVTTFTGRQAQEIIAEATRRQTPVVLTHRGAAGWETFKSQLVPGRHAEHILVGDPHSDEHAKGLPVAAGTVLGVSFRRGHKKCMFASVVDDRQRVIAGGQPVNVLALRRADVLHMLQRRIYHRTPVPADKKINVVVRCAEDPADRQGDARAMSVLRGVLRNVSAGGMAVAVRPDSAVRLTVGQTVRSDIHLPGGRALNVDANYRHQTMVGEELQLGFQFVGLETSEGGRHALEQLSRFSIQLQRSYQ
jgi:c-di-GMP-binding flagellar brake protein YcgR